MSSHIRIFVRLEDSERFKIVCFNNKTCSFDQLIEKIATTLQVVVVVVSHDVGTLLLVAGAEEAAEVTAVDHIRDGDRCIFVPVPSNKKNAPSHIAVPNREPQLQPQRLPQPQPQPQHGDQEAAVDLTSSEDSDLGDDNDNEDEEIPKKETRFFYKHGGILYPVMVWKKQSARQRNLCQGECYIRHNGMRGTAWESYRRPICVKVSDLLAYTNEREQKYKKRIQIIIKGKSKKSPKKGKRKKERKQPARRAKYNEEDGSSSDEGTTAGKAMPKISRSEVASLF